MWDRYRTLQVTHSAHELCDAGDVSLDATCVRGTRSFRRGDVVICHKHYKDATVTTIARLTLFGRMRERCEAIARRFRRDG